jgi:hypothetical protein
MQRTAPGSRIHTDGAVPGRYLLEHGLKSDGRVDPDATDVGEAGSFETFFTETASGKYVPRSIFVDLDPSVGDRGDQCFHAKLTSCSQLMRSVPVPIASFSIRKRSSAGKKMPQTIVRVMPQCRCRDR